jgi:L-alanine-DL-glutamate epimerase-like enolase superfamily enzyme
VSNEQGEQGWGEADPTPNPKYPQAPKLKKIVDGALTSAILGSEIGNFVLLHKKMDTAVPGYYAAKAALEMACYDLLGETLGFPVWHLIGGKIHEEISLIAWIGAGTVEKGRQQASSYVEAGFDTLKVKIGYGPDTDEARIRAIREEVGDKVAIRVDANNTYNRDQALESLKRLEAYNIFHYEDPIHMDDLEGMAWLRRRVPVRLMADKVCVTPNDLIRVIRAESADIVKLSVQVNGGIYKTVQMMQIAAAAGIPATLGHSFSLATNTYSEVHVGASAPNLLTPCEFVGHLKVSDDVVKKPLELGMRKIQVPNLPGLGVEIHPGKLEQYRMIETGEGRLHDSR